MKQVLLICFFLFLLLPLPHELLAQRAVSGKITSSEDNSDLPGVNVLVKGTANGTTTNANGIYSLDVPAQATLVFSYIGYVTQEIPVTNQTAINVVLRPDVTQLTEVVVTGYGTQERKDIIGSIATVSSEKFKDIPIAGIDQALQGQASGVQVTQSSGTPGGGITVRVRGATSVSASNRPLFIVDGVPVEDGALALRDFGGQNDNALSTINPNDVESINVYKDVATKAIYGSRAANGVVYITTKRGKNDSRTVINADVQHGIIDPVRKIELLNATELLELQQEAVRNAGGNPEQLGLISGVTDAVNTDWLDAVFRRGIYQQYQLNARGGNERTRFYASGNYRNEEGVQLNNRFERYTGTLNLDHKVSNKLSFGNNLLLARTKNMRVKGDNFLDGVYSGALKSLPFFHPYDEQGRLIGPSDPAYPSFPNFNPVGQAILPRFDTYTTKIVGGIFADYSFLPELKLTSKFSIDYNGVTEDQFEPSSTAIGGYLLGRGYGVYSTGTYSTLINTNVLTYTRTLKEKHSFNILLGSEILQRTERTSSVTGQEFPSDEYTFSYIASAGVVNQGSSFLLKNGLVSFFTKVNYDLADKYLFSITARQDGSSRFGRGRQFGFFPSAAAAWRISGEPFMQNFAFVNDLKLRASFGYTGNERIGDFEYLGTFSAATYSGSSGLAPSRLENAELQWERTREVDFGVDASLWNGRINITADAYDNLTDKLLFDQPIPSTTGFETVKGNIGKVANKGFELGVNSINFDGNFKWSTSLNFSRNLNKVIELVDTLPIFRGYTASQAGNTNVVLPGQPLGTFWGLEFLGVDPATGDAIYQDINGDGEITDQDATIIGNAQPDFLGGITNTVSWKGFDLSVFFQFSYGNDILNFTNTGLLNSGEDLNTNQVREALKRWRKPGDITSVPRYEYESTFNNYHSSRFIEDGSYVRLKNLTLGYRLPPNMISRLKLNNARVYVSGTNLWTLTPYTGSDPEVSTLDGSTTAQGIDFYTLPQVRTVIIGLNLGF
ncbi:TonB-dependent receptor [Rhodocytophaga aerolata]|uniref:TonB-dependent receptor n=1 Tax=Rhodocytophaga aerolata TaxID=455078 RepID=A0ABT8RBG7_9BACT|nr:TonB-dependent receptor [Rhodocytophaga aerolata]MDO1448553.1 TonB-dependent receptor [Rhodocytophaga aerolata]